MSAAYKHIFVGRSVKTNIPEHTLLYNCTMPKYMTQLGECFQSMNNWGFSEERGITDVGRP